MCKEIISIQVIDDKGELKSAVTITREKAVSDAVKIIFKELEPCLKPFYKVPKEKRGCVLTAAEKLLNALFKGGK